MLGQRGALLDAADVAGEHAPDLETGLGAARPGHPPEPQRQRDTLEPALAQRLTAEVALHDAPDRLAHDDRPGIRLRLHPRGDVRRVALCKVLALGADHPHHHAAGVHPDAHLGPHAVPPRRGCLVSVHLAQDVEPATDGPPGVVLVGARESEVDDDAVAEKMGDIPIVMRDDLGANAL